MPNSRKSKWKEIWDKRSADVSILQSGEPDKIFRELKRSNGFDVLEDEIFYEAFVEQYEDTKKNLSLHLPQGKKLESLFEVGCGSGANLFLFENDGITCGGLDYSQQLVTSAKQILHTKDIFCIEASSLPTESRYDALLSNSVFSYFPDEYYAATVLESMYKKAIYSIGIIDIHDKQREQDFLSFRKQTIPDYEECYKDLRKLFYDRQFFAEFARRHHLEMRITDSKVKGYWNNEFVGSVK